MVGRPELSSASHDTLHQDPVWRSRADFIINAPLPEVGRFEQLWCRRLEESSFEICCIPFFLYDVSLGDVVETQATSQGRFMYRRVTKRSGRFVFRAHLLGDAPDAGVAVERSVNDAGGLTEWATPTLLAIDADTAELATRLADYLQGEENDGRLVYETGQH